MFLNLTEGAMISHGICPACAKELYGERAE